MKERSQALLASAVLAVGSAAAAVAAEPPLKTLPSQQDIWITGTIQRGNGQYAPGEHTSLRLDRPSTSPCNDKVVTMGRQAYWSVRFCRLIWGSKSRSRGASSVRIPVSGIRFTPTPDFLFPIY
jgi:hypothetical protein